MRKGLFDYNRATIRTTYWARTYYKPGQSLASQAKKLKNHKLAKDTLVLFRKAIEAKEKSVITDPQRIINLEKNGSSKSGETEIHCPVCDWKNMLPSILDGISKQTCSHCRAEMMIKKNGALLLVTCYGRTVNKLTLPVRKDIITAWKDMALLYRMMNMFYHANSILNKAESLVGVLIDDEENNDYWELKSLILFHLAESYQTQGIETNIAKTFYERSLDIDKKTGIRNREELIKSLMAKIA